MAVVECLPDGCGVWFEGGVCCCGAAELEDGRHLFANEESGEWFPSWWLESLVECSAEGASVVAREGCGNLALVLLAPLVSA